MNIEKKWLHEFMIPVSLTYIFVGNLKFFEKESIALTWQLINSFLGKGVSFI